MLRRPPSRDRDRARWRTAKREQRLRERGGVRRVSITYGPVVVEALIAQGLDAGMSEDAAGRESRNRKKVAADLADVVEHWARRYLSERAGGAS
jgi:hypothetical protein